MAEATVEFASEALKNETLALDATERFYAALNRMFAGDLGPMSEIWTKDADVVLMGPYGGRQIGRTDVQRMFEKDASLKHAGQIMPRDLLVRVGDELAYSVCIERGEITTSTEAQIPVDVRGTNILKRQGEDWRVVYHHTDLLPQMQEASNLKIEEFPAAPVQAPDPDVIKALDQLFAAVNSMFAGDLEPLYDVWANTDDVTFASPVGNIQVGWSAVRAEFERHSKAGIQGSLQYKDLFTRIYGDLAYASCLSYAPDLTINGKPYAFNQRETVVFRREGDSWLVVHLHQDLGAGLAELCG